MRTIAENVKLDDFRNSFKDGYGRRAVMLGGMPRTL